MKYFNFTPKNILIIHISTFLKIKICQKDRDTKQDMYDILKLLEQRIFSTNLLKNQEPVVDNIRVLPEQGISLCARTN